MAKTEKLTKSFVKEATPPSSGERFVWDSNLPGFGLRIYASGRKAFCVQFRSKRTGRTQRPTIGVFGTVTVDEARAKAREILAQNQLGNDPFPQAAAPAITLRVLYDKWVADKAPLHRKTLAPRSTASVANDKGRMATHVLPKLGDRLITEITKADVEALRDSTLRKRGQQRNGKGYRGKLGGPSAARRAVATLKSVLAYGVDLGMLSHNVASLVDLPKEENAARFLTESELKSVLDHLNTLKSPPEHAFSIAILQLLIYTGCRRSEIEKLRWSEVSLEDERLYLANTKTGQRHVPLNSRAVSILKKQCPFEGKDFVFPSLTKDGSHYQGTDKLWRRVRTKLNLPGVRMHDLRHSYASLLARDGTSLQVIGKILGHKKVETTQRYAHLVDDEVRLANERAVNRLKPSNKKKGAQRTTSKSEDS